MLPALVASMTRSSSIRNIYVPAPCIRERNTAY